jgi:nitric oxide reductase subunit C
MENRGVRNLFIGGSLAFFVVFVGLTYDTMKKHDSRVPPITEEVSRGKMLWHKYDCIGCHTIFGNGSYFGPDLTKTTRNKPASYLRTFLMDPKATNKAAAMPRLGITESEAADIVAFLDWTSGVDTNGWPPEPVLASLLRKGAAGNAVYEREGCRACHMLGGIGGTSGPDLTHVGSARPDRAWQIEHLRDPASLAPGSAMPPFAHLSDEDLGTLADFLVTLK